MKTPNPWLRAVYATACVLIGVAFLFNWYLAVYVSSLATVLFVCTSATLVPTVSRWLASRPLLSVHWLRYALVLALLAVSLQLLIAGDHAPVMPRHNSAYTNATIITGHADAEVIDRGVVLVDKRGVITEVGTTAEVEIPESFEVVDLTGKFVLPGLINAHDHLMMFGERDPFEPADFSGYALETPEGLGEWFIQTYPVKRLVMAMMERNSRKALAAGVTTVRQLATIDFLDVGLRDKIERGERIGPRILAAGPPLCITGGHGHQIGRVISGPVDARDAVREALAHRVDVIKITSTGGVADSRRIGEAGELQMTPGEIRAIVDEAHRKNILVTAHVESEQGVLEALRAGVDNIEHGASLNEEAIALFKNNPLSLRGYSTLHPTLSVLGGGVVKHDSNNVSPRLNAITVNAEMVREEIINGYRTALANGVHIGAGTDSGVVTHASVWAEMSFFIEFGNVSNLKAIHMGTLATAQSIGIDDITGSVEAGKYADLLIVENDPRQYIDALAEPFMVVARGWRY